MRVDPLATKSFGGSLSLRQIPRTEDDGMVQISQLARDFQPQPFVGAGDQSNFSFVHDAIYIYDVDMFRSSIGSLRVEMKPCFE
jgi:hypothetical protein